MTEKRKRLSIILSAYNEEMYIEAAVRSILDPFTGSDAANLYDLEVIALDDGSTDNTLKILKNIDHPSLKVFENPNKGKVNAYNFGLQKSVGNFVILFSGDDIFNVASIVPRLAPIRDTLSPAATFCALQAFRGSPEFTAQRFPKSGGGARAGGAIAMNRAFVEKALPIPIDMPNEDSWLCLNADFRETFTVDVDVVGMWYRLHEQNTSSYGSGDAVKQREALLMRSEVYQRFYIKHAAEISVEKRARLNREIAAHAMARSGNLLSIMMLSKYPLMRRIRAAFLSSPTLWKLRTILGARVSGLVGH